MTDSSFYSSAANDLKSWLDMLDTLLKVSPALVPQAEKALDGKLAAYVPAEMLALRGAARYAALRNAANAYRLLGRADAMFSASPNDIFCSGLAPSLVDWVSKRWMRDAIEMLEDSHLRDRFVASQSSYHVCVTPFGKENLTDADIDDLRSIFGSYHIFRRSAVTVYLIPS